MSFTDYIKGKRRGKDARRIELEAMSNPFLEEAIEGFDMIKGDHASRIAGMQRKISAKSRRRKRPVWITTAAAIAVVLIVGYFAYTLFLPVKETQTCDSLILFVPESYINEVQYSDKAISPKVEIGNPEIFAPQGEIDIYVPKEYIERKRINAASNKSEAEVTPKATIINIEEVFTPEEAIIIYLPQKYLHRNS